MKAEELMDIPGFEGYYKIDRVGNVFSTRKNKFLIPGDCMGYNGYTLSIGKSKYKRLEHRLVAETFIDNPLAKRCVNHKDGNKKNNQVCNLEWCTYSENEQHSRTVLGKKIQHSDETKNKISIKAKYRHAKTGYMNEIHRLAMDKIRGKPSHNRRKVLLNGRTEFDSITSAASVTGISISAISNNLKGISKSTKVGTWKYLVKN